jgi:hypothetical protein
MLSITLRIELRLRELVALLRAVAFVLAVLIA